MEQHVERVGLKAKIERYEGVITSAVEVLRYVGHDATDKRFRIAYQLEAILAQRKEGDA